MRWFLDMCIILYYVGEGDRPDLNKKTKKFVQEKKNDNFLLCYYIRDENLPKWVERQKISLREIIKKLRDNSYILYTSSESRKLNNRDKKKITKLLILLERVSDTDEKIKRITNVILELERRINYFLQNYVDKFVIPVENIDPELKSHLLNFLNLESSNKNVSDAMTISSGIQEHQNKPLKMITGDRNDWRRDLIEEVNYHPNLMKKYQNLPEINYIQDL